MLHWGLTAAAVLLFLYAVRTTFLAGRKGDDARGEQLGCGFAVAAVALWIYVLQHHLDDPWRAIRLGLGVLLVLPAVQALARPQGARILRAAGALIVAFLLAGPVVRDLWTEHGPDTRPESERELAGLIEEYEAARDALLERDAALDLARAESLAKLKVAGGWEAVEADPELQRELRVIAAVDDARGEIAVALAQVEARLETARLELARGSEAEAPTASDQDELEAWLEAVRASAPDEEDLSLVEEHLLQQELKALYEVEIQGE